MFKKIISIFSFSVLLLALAVFPSYADTVSVDFESYSLGTINAQDGWSSLGAAGSGCAVYDHAVSASLSTVGFDSKSLRISNAVTSGCFGDMTFAKPLTDAVGETGATAGSFSVGTRQTHFEMQFDIASTKPTEEQPGLFMSVSPDRGDGSRMAYVGFEDVAGGIDIIFYDVQGTGNPANFVPTDLGVYSRTPHTIKLTLDTLDGPSNDVVKVWIDGVLVHTGTSWENYYRFDSEASAEQSVRIVKTAIFRTGGPAAPATAGNGFLIDNLSLTSLNPILPSVPEIITPSNGAIVTVSNMVKVDWTDSIGGTFPPFEYQYRAFSDAGYTSTVYTSGWLTNSEIPTLGTPPGDYYVQVRAQDTEGNISDWSNGSSAPYHITVIADPILIGPPTNKDECKKDGWKTFNNPTFKNQGACVSYVVSNENAGKRD